MKDSKASLVAGIAAGLAFVLALLKLILFLSTGSMVVALSALDSFVDALISLLNRKVLTFARTEADLDHPYGHGKAESIAALGQGAVILSGAVTVIASSLYKLAFETLETSKFLEYGWEIAIFFFISAIFSVCISLLLSHYGKKENSPALKADAEHYRVDVLANLGTVLTFVLISLTEFVFLDQVMAVIFAVYIFREGMSLCKQATEQLMDHDITEEVKNKATQIVHSVSSQIIDVHKLRGRESGHRYLLDFHITLPATLSFGEVHEIVEKVEAALDQGMDADAVVHADPDDL